MTVITTTLTPPPAMEMGDDPLLIVGFAWASPHRAAGEAAIGRLRDMAPPDQEEVGDNRWVQWQSILDEMVPKGVRAYWRNTSFDRLDAEVIDVLTRRGSEQTWSGTAFDVHHLGGALGRVPEEATAFPNRSARFWINIHGFWDDAAVDDDRIAFVRGLSRDMDRFATGGQYLNFQGQRARRSSTARSAHGLRPGEVPAAGRGQAPVRPRQPLPRQPQHPSRLTPGRQPLVRGGIGCCST